MTILFQVECGNCGWKGKRKLGQLVTCPQCQSIIAAFQVKTEFKPVEG